MNAVKTVRNLGLGLWVGGTAAIDFVDAPARFKTPGLDRNAITAVGRSVFAAWSRYELGLGTVTVMTALLATRGKGGKRTVALVVPMWLLSVVQFSLLQPRMRAAAEGLDFVNRDENEPRYAIHRKYHSAYMAADGVKFLLGLAANMTSNG